MLCYRKFMMMLFLMGTFSMGFKLKQMFSLSCKSYKNQLRKISSTARFNQLYASSSSYVGVDSTITNSEDYSWDFVDIVYLITTTVTDPNRFERTKSQLESVNLWNKVKIFKVEPDDEDRVRGCYTSHIGVLQSALKECKRDDMRVLILEDNLETTVRIQKSSVQSAKQFLATNKKWDMLHLAYMMYVPALSVKRIEETENIVQINGGPNAALGTTAYIISKDGIKKLLAYHNKNGYSQPIPNVIAELFQQSRYGVYPMIFHRAGKVSSLVNPQMNDFRKIVFNPVTYSTWEWLMVNTGLNNNQLFPGVCATLLFVMGGGFTAALHH